MSLTGLSRELPSVRSPLWILVVMPCRSHPSQTCYKKRYPHEWGLRGRCSIRYTETPCKMASPHVGNPAGRAAPPGHLVPSFPGEWDLKSILALGYSMFVMRLRWRSLARRRGSWPEYISTEPKGSINFCWSRSRVRPPLRRSRHSAPCLPIICSTPT